MEAKGKIIVIELPEDGRSRELLREFQNKPYHGELVVTLNSEGEIQLTVYPISEKVEPSNLPYKNYSVLKGKREVLLG